LYTVYVVVSRSALRRLAIASSDGSSDVSDFLGSPPLTDGMSVLSKSMFQSNLPMTRLATVRNDNLAARFFPPGARSIPRENTVTKAFKEKA